MSKVDYKELRSAVVVMTNEVDTAREYEISANVSIQGNEANSWENGTVHALGQTEGEAVCTFSVKSWDRNRTNYSGIDQEHDHCAVVAAIQAFIADCKAKVAEGGVAGVMA